jgi:hypothetical protein
MAQFMPVNPRPFLQDLYVIFALLRRAPVHTRRSFSPLDTQTYKDKGKQLTQSNHCRVNKEIWVRLKWGETEYKGRL